MLMRIFRVLLIVILAIGLMGCFSSNEVEFPIGVTRISDGTEIRLGMNLLEVAQLFEPDYYRESSGMIITPNNVGEVFFISIYAEHWMLAGENFVGNNIQNVIGHINSGIFTNFPHRHNAEYRYISLVDNYEHPLYWLIFIYDEDGITTNVSLTYMPDAIIWNEQQSEQ